MSQSRTQSVPPAFVLPLPWDVRIAVNSGGLRQSLQIPQEPASNSCRLAEWRRWRAASLGNLGGGAVRLHIRRSDVGHSRSTLAHPDARVRSPSLLPECCASSPPRSETPDGPTPRCPDSMRSCRRLKIQSRSLLCKRTKAVPFCAAGVVKRRLNSAHVFSKKPIGGSRPCQVP